jgi:anti-anti-sigma factor
MKIEAQLRPPVLILTISGRLDAFTSRTLEERLAPIWADASIHHLILNLPGLEYLSSAGIRVLVTALRQMRHRGGDLCLVGLQGYPQKVIAMSGFAEALPHFPTRAAALAAAGITEAAEAHWAQATPFAGKVGSYQVVPWRTDPCEALVLGRISDVLCCRVTPELMRSKRFSATEYSLGLGGLGEKPADYIPILGEMITIGGTMVWLPTDGHDTADYLIPQNDTGEVTIQTAFNVSLAGHFNDLVMFTSPLAQGSALGDIYRDLFELARTRRTPFKGGLFLTMRAEVHAAYGAGVLRSPILTNQPENGKPIIDPENFETWFEVDHVPRHTGVTGLFSGIGLDLHSDYAKHYDQAMIDDAFYVNPGNRSASHDQTLHNHGVFFSPLPFNADPHSVEEEIHAVVENGDFRDMRHLFDNTRVTRALIGVAYIEQFTRDPAGAA